MMFGRLVEIGRVDRHLDSTGFAPLPNLAGHAGKLINPLHIYQTLNASEPCRLGAERPSYPESISKAAFGAVCRPGWPPERPLPASMRADSGSVPRRQGRPEEAPP